MKELKLELQLKLNKAKAVDLEILEKYIGKEVVIDTESDTYGGITDKIGLEFIYLTDCKKYYSSIEYLDIKKTEEFSKTSDRTLSRSQIEKIVLLEDLKKQGEK